MPSTTTPSVIAAVSLGAIVDVKDKNSLYATWLLAHGPISGPIMTIKINHWIKTTKKNGIWTHHDHSSTIG
jgi:hypothetical protein